MQIDAQALSPETYTAIERSLAQRAREIAGALAGGEHEGRSLAFDAEVGRNDNAAQRLVDVQRTQARRRDEAERVQWARDDAKRRAALWDGRHDAMAQLRTRWEQLGAEADVVVNDARHRGVPHELVAQAVLDRGGAIFAELVALNAGLRQVTHDARFARTDTFADALRGAPELLRRLSSVPPKHYDWEAQLAQVRGPAVPERPRGPAPSPIPPDSGRALAEVTPS